MEKQTGCVPFLDPTIKENMSKHIYKFLLVVIIFLACTSQLVWLKLNLAPPRMWDDTGYLAVSADFYNKLTQSGLVEFARALFNNILNFHPPLVMVLPIPFYFIFGEDPSSSLLCYTVFIALFCLYLFRLTKEIFDNEKIALLAVITTCLFPLVFGLWRQLMMEFGLMTLTVISLFYLVKSNEFRERKPSIFLGILLGLGLLLKITFPLFLIGPVVYFFIRGLTSTEGMERNKIVQNLALVLLLGALLASTWYIKNLGGVLQHAYGNAIGEEGQPWSRDMVGYWTEIINFGISVYFFGLMIVLFLLVICLRKKVFSPKMKWFLIIWFLVPFSVGSFSVVKEIRHILPIFPVFGIVIAAFLVALLPERRKLQIVLLPVLFIFPIYNFLYFSFDIPLIARKDVRYGPFILFTKDLESLSFELSPVYTFPPHNKKWPLDDVLQVITESRGDLTEPVIGLVSEHPLFSYTHLWYLAELKRLDLIFMSLIYPDINDPLSANFLIEIEGQTKKYGPAHYNNMELQEKLKNRRLPFEEIARIALPDNSEAVIYKKMEINNYSLRLGQYDNLNGAEILPEGEDSVRQDLTFSINQDERKVIFQHPDSKITFKNIFIHDSTSLKFGIGIDPSAWDKGGDGVSFEVIVNYSGGDYVLFSKYINPKSKLDDRRWHDEIIDLSAFGNQAVAITLVTEGGPNNNTDYDWAGWSNLELIYKKSETKEK